MNDMSSKDTKPPNILAPILTQKPS